MEPLHVTLREDSRIFHFSFDSVGNREYSIRRRSGMLERNFNGGWKNRSIETGSAEEGRTRKGAGRGTHTGKTGTELSMDAGRILEEHSFLIDFLNRSTLPEWKISFRTESNDRTVVRAGRGEVNNRFTHFSVVVKFRCKDFPGEMEVGEGTTGEFKFNQNGLAQRIDEMNRHHRMRKRMPQPEEIPVVLQAGDGAIFFHEILGHSLEADYVYHRLSPFSRLDLGKKVVPGIVTVRVADGRDDFFKGSPRDDEGERAASPVLIEDGVLRHFISDSFYRNLLNLKEAGHSRTEDFTRLPIPRMFALYIMPGAFSPDEIVASIPRGILAREFGDGKVHFHKNNFHFTIREAFRIENGRIAAPLGHVRVYGEIKNVLNEIGMIGNDFKYDRGVSYCYKNGQVVHVRVGQPTVRIDGLTVLQAADD
jgi:predicted Zn-dependent protease